MEMHKEMGMKGLKFFNEFITAFRPRKPRSWARTEAGKWINYLRENGSTWTTTDR